ncbi:cytochrome [Prescottella equi]|uniref:cytochrome P450 n=1 Tax=Rhodococcus hoagii TaxID=43767 RepID=UPI0009C1102A|nr:cytochrome P450 [Prescottella equi]OQQ31494.1 cytochrome [Prescottella equi]
MDGLGVFDPAHLDDPYSLYATLRERDPVHRVPGTDFHLVSSWELVTEALARPEDFSSNLTGVMVQQTDGPPVTFDMDGGGRAVHVLATADDPSHAVHRKLVLAQLAKRIRTLGPTVRTLVDELWDVGLRADGTFEWAREMADALPLALVASLIGLPQSDVPQLLSWSYDSTEMLGGVVTTDRLPTLVASAAALTGYLYTKFSAAKRDPQTDLLGVLAHACNEGDLTDDVAVLILVQLVGAGGESTAGLIANAARILATDPELQDRLRNDPQLIDAFLDEALRLESPFRGHHRHVVADTTLGGIPLPAGSHLLLLWGAANRDPAAFADPDTVRLDRPNLKGHLAFGRGIHFCVGSALARTEALAALTTLLERTTSFTIADGGAEWVPSLMVRRHRLLRLELNLR